MMGRQGEHGLYLLAARELLERLERDTILVVSFYEIYAGKLFDLLNDRGSSGSTHVNDRSSRSHAVLVFYIRPRREQRVFARISFVDLAGSERAQDTLDLDKKTRAEGAEINRSLLALKECVRAMHERKKHVPFRGSKLTQVLRDSFSGSCVTVMIANVSPCLVHTDDTVNTLKYTDRIKTMPSGATGSEGAVAAQSVEPDLCDKCGFPILVDDKSLHVCPKQYVPCKFCKMEIVKTKLQRHFQECLEVPVACPDCGLRATRGQMYAHPDKCPSATFTCVTCNQKVPRRQRDTHALTDCPEAKKPCIHCRAPFKRKELTEHAAVCPQRQIACPGCGFLVKQGMMKEHARSCIGSRDRPRTNNTVSQTPSRLPPLTRDALGSTLTSPMKSPGGGKVVHVDASSPLKASSGSSFAAHNHPLLPPPLVESTAEPAPQAKSARGPSKPKPKAKKTSTARGDRTPTATELVVPEPAAPAAPAATSHPRPVWGTHKADSTNRKAVAPVPVPQPPLQASPTQVAPRPATPVVLEMRVPPVPMPPSCSLCGAKGTTGQPLCHGDACPEAPMPCPFAEAGCAAVLKRREVDGHVTASVANHLMLVHSHSMKVHRENQSLRDKLKEAERQVAQQRPAPVPEPPTSRGSPSRVFESTGTSSQFRRSPLTGDPEPPPPPRTPPAKRDSKMFALSEKTARNTQRRPPR
jgi:hypothetical protein